MVSSSAAQRRRPVEEAPVVEAPVATAEPEVGAAAEAPVAVPEEGAVEAAPLLKEADPEFERLLAEEEEIERTTRDHHETPRFHMGDD